MQPKQSAFDNIQEDKIDELILNYLNTPKFQTSLNSLIISTLSNRKNMSLSRKGIADKIISHEYIKDVENEISSIKSSIADVIHPSYVHSLFFGIFTII